MIITDVKVRKLFNDGPMKAIVSATFDNQLAVHDIKVIEGERGLFIAMPSKPTPDGGHRDTAHPINEETRKMFEDLIFEEYNKGE